MKKIPSVLQHQSGFGLIEVMISMTLGLMLMLGITALLSSNNATYRLTDNVGKVQENARFLRNRLSSELRAIGYKGCISKQDIAITNTLNNATDQAYNFSDSGLVGYDNVSASLPTELTTLIGNDPKPIVGSDVLLIRSPHGDSIPVVANNDSTQLFASSAANTTFAIGDIVMISDCEKARIFQITNISKNDNGGKVNIVHGNKPMTPGNAEHNWGPPATDESFGISSSLIAFGTTTYFVANNPDTNKPALYQKVNASPAMLLVNGVYAFQIRYGEDNDGDHQVDIYRDASTVANWNNVITIRIEMVLGSDETGMVTAPQKLALSQSTFNAPDTRWYMTTTVVATLRNRIN